MGNSDTINRPEKADGHTQNPLGGGWKDETFQARPRGFYYYFLILWRKDGCSVRR